MADDGVNRRVPASSSVALLVISIDRDLWPPFFELLWRHWPDCPYPIHLGSETQTFGRGLPRPLDAELLHAAAQGARVEVEDQRCAALAFDHPIGLP